VLTLIYRGGASHRPNGRVETGIGKKRLIAQKIAATFKYGIIHFTQPMVKSARRFRHDLSRRIIFTPEIKSLLPLIKSMKIRFGIDPVMHKAPYTSSDFAIIALSDARGLAE
jgi:hypothetical protein